jgi:Icc-related predicted phosphoesterase
MAIKVLTLSDVQIEFIYSPRVQSRFPDVDLVIGCGDLPYYYIEYVGNALDVPLYFVRGNHASQVEYTVAGPRTAPLGAIDLHRRVVRHNGLLLAGVEGSLRYRESPYQYSQAEMWGHVFRLLPSLMLNRVIQGRFLDVFVSHAPPWGIHDQPDLPHQGIKAFLWLLRVFRPAYHFHGHIHIYRSDTVTKTRFLETQVINTYGFLETTIEENPPGFAPLSFLGERNKTTKASFRGEQLASTISTDPKEND